MEIHLYKTASPKKQVTKSLSNLLTLEGTLRDECEVVAPTVVVEGDTDIMTYNYAFIPVFGRYYYVKPKALRTSVFQLSLSVDVLMSFNTEIRSNSAIIDRTEVSTFANTYVENGTTVSTAKLQTATYNFSGGFNDSPEYILITAGGIS